jgi:hypothetical protein
MNPLPADPVEHARALLRDARAELRTASRLGPEVDAQLAAALGRLDEPLRVALAGTLKSGKSTLLNALVGEEIAPTDACECTRVVTWFGRSRTPRVHLVHDGGRRTPLPVRRTDGRLALDLGGVDEDRVEHLAVGWPSSLLERYTIIDTPGTSSNSAEVSARTEAFLTPEDGDCPADAVVYLMRSAHSCDLALLRRLDEHSGASGPLGVVGVLSRADELDGGEPGSLAAARLEGSRLTAEPGGPRQDWIAVSGLLALRGHTLRQAEFTALATIAALPPDQRESALLSPGRFLAGELPMPADERERLLTGFGLGGIRAAVELILAVPPTLPRWPPPWSGTAAWTSCARPSPLASTAAPPSSRRTRRSVRCAGCWSGSPGRAGSPGCCGWSTGHWPTPTSSPSCARWPAWPRCRSRPRPGPRWSRSSAAGAPRRPTGWACRRTPARPGWWPPRWPRPGTGARGWTTRCSTARPGGPTWPRCAAARPYWPGRRPGYP